MSALPPNADIDCLLPYVRFVPEADMTARHDSGLTSETPIRNYPNSKRAKGRPINNQINHFVSAASQVRTGKGVKNCSRTAATKITAT
jgi:hypothetical protein